MIGAGTVINPIIKIVTTVVIIGAIYLFFVKPALDTTEDITNRAFEGVPNAAELQEQIQNSFNGVPDSAKIEKSIQNSIDAQGVGGIDSDKLLSCIQNASQDVDRIQRCTKRFGP